MAAKWVKMVICTLVLLLCTGCWDSVDLDSRSLFTSYIVDKTDNGYAFYVEIATITSNLVNPAQEQQQGQKPTIIRSEGATFTEARADLDRIVAKPLFLGANQALLFTERMARSGIEEYMYRVRAMPDFRKSEDVAVLFGDPREFLDIQPQNATTVGFAVEYSIQNDIDEGHGFHVTAEDVLEKLSSFNNKAFLMKTLAVKEGQPAIVAYAVFDGGKCLGFIPREEGRGIVYTYSRALGSRAPNFDYVVPWSGGMVAVRVELTQNDISPSYRDGKVYFDLEYHFYVEELYPWNANPVTEAAVREIKGGLKAMLEEDIWKAVNASQKDFGVDFMSFSEPFRISYPDAYEKMDWKREFPGAKFSLKVVIDHYTCKGFTYDPYNR